MKTKMEMAHDMALELVKIKPDLAAWQIADRCFEYADAMQAEEDKTRPEVLCRVDWSIAPNDAIGWMSFDGVSTWLGEEGYLIEDAPSFGFTGSCVVERPE